MNNFMALGCLAVALAVVGCQAPVETKPVTKDLGPAELGSYGVGSKWLGLRDGKEQTVTLVSIEDQKTSYETSWGCSWTREKNYFTPATKFANCGGNTGSQTITRRSGSIWPLEIGKSQSWSLIGRNTSGNSWETTRRCKVESAERVRVPAGEFDTYKVVCRDSWRTRTWYHAPAIKSSVLFTNYHRKKNSTLKWELISAPNSQ